jgi:hypothetical protein
MVKAKEETMSHPTLTPTAGQWPPEVLEFAEQRRVRPFLEPLLEATWQLFPTAEKIEIFFERDQELRDVGWIVFEVRAPQQDVPNFVEAQRRWNCEALRICSAPLVCNFVLTLWPT